MYPVEKDFVSREDVVGVVRGYVPCIGIPNLVLNDSLPCLYSWWYFNRYWCFYQLVAEYK